MDVWCSLFCVQDPKVSVITWFVHCILQSIWLVESIKESRVVEKISIQFIKSMFNFERTFQMGWLFVVKEAHYTYILLMLFKEDIGVFESVCNVKIYFNYSIIIIMLTG